MNKTVASFFAKHGFNITELMSDTRCHIKTIKDIDFIIANFAFEEEEFDTYVSIEDIVGFEKQDDKSAIIFYNLDTFFDREGAPYHQRSCGLLEIDPENIVDDLYDSFYSAPISLTHVCDGKYVIRTNGLHRYIILRAHFLKETHGLDPASLEYKDIVSKYTIPVKQRNINLSTTFANFLISKYPDFKMSLNAQYDEAGQPTGNFEIREDGIIKWVVSSQVLIDVVRDMVINNNDSLYFAIINRACKISDKFALFMDMYIPEYKELNQNLEIGVQGR